jgi:hypothetical protein
LIGAHRKAAQQRRTPKRGRKVVTHFTLGVLECAGAPALSGLHRIAVQPWLRAPVIALSFVNLFARQSRFHLIKLLETNALHAYATII